MIAMKILKTVLDTWGYRELLMWNKKITSYEEIQKFDVKKQRWASRTDTRTFKNEFAVSELVENELGPLGRWNYSETIFILNTVYNKPLNLRLFRKFVCIMKGRKCKLVNGQEQQMLGPIYCAYVF